jgi:hypothetical protein
MIKTNKVTFTHNHIYAFGDIGQAWKDKLDIRQVKYGEF